jgi:hypothetical protein
MYFSGYRDHIDAAELSETPVQPRDVGGDRLPFGHLDDRCFEILAYRLLCHANSSAEQRVTLMQGVADRGRDVVVYSKEGILIKIVQCKHYGTKFTAPSLRKELLKLALHNHLEPSILGSSSVIYELWCPSGITGPASELISSWPRLWTPANLASDADEVIESYVSFNGLKWKEIAETVTLPFAKIVKPVLFDDLLITDLVKAAPPIYEKYFVGRVFLGRDDALEAFAQVQEGTLGEMRRILETSFAKLTDSDGRLLLERITAFPVEKRHAHLTGYVMGLSPELISRFNGEEFADFARHSINATLGIIHTVLSACSRLAWEHGFDFRERVRPDNAAITPVLVQVLTFSMTGQVTGMLMGTRALQPDLEAFVRLDLRQRFAWCGPRLWDSYQQCISAYDPVRHADGSIEERRFQIAVNGMDRATTGLEFENRLMRALDKNLLEVTCSYNDFMRFVPSEILVITDTVSAFENRALAGRVRESSSLIERLRGSSIPE